MYGMTEQQARFTFSGGWRDPAGDQGDDRPWVSIQWTRTQWSVDVESYVEEGGSNPAPIEDAHLSFILSRYGIPDGLFPLPSIITTSPAKLQRLGDSIRQVGVAPIRALLSHFASVGLSVQAYLGGGAWGDVFLAAGDGGVGGGRGGLK